MSRNVLLAVALVIAAVAVAIAGCSGGSKNSGTLIGADIFDPDSFSMAIYDVTLADGSNGGFVVFSNTSGTGGDVLTSVAFQGNVSSRADTLISKDHKKTLNVLLSEINDTSLQFSGGEPMFNMTTLDEAWNALDAEYAPIGSADVTVPAGDFNGSKCYGSNKTLVYGGESAIVQVRYYMHSSAPVPVKFEVTGPDGTYTYNLKHVYLQGDTASTPERVVQSFFDDLDNGRLDEAFQCLAVWDEGSNSFKAPDDATYRQFLENMNRTYKTGDESYRVQYVDVRSTEPVSTLQGGNMYLVLWDSIHYQVGTLSVYRLSGSFYVTEIKGQWRIIV